jgi:hypothetical protein
LTHDLYIEELNPTIVTGKERIAKKTYSAYWLCFRRTVVEYLKHNHEIEKLNPTFAAEKRKLKKKKLIAPLVAH